VSEPASTEKTAAEAEKLRWEAQSAKLDAERKERENAEWDSEPARRLRAAEALQKQIATLVPDLSGVDKGELAVTGVLPVGAHQALDRAAGQVAAAVGPLLDRPVLLTTDSDLVTASAVATQLELTLTNLIEAAEALSPPPAQRDLVAPATVATTLAAAVPSVLGLLTSKRSLTTGAVATDDLSAAAAVAGALLAAKKTVHHDDFRTVPQQSPILDQLGVLQSRRRRLARLKSAAADALIAEIDQFVTSAFAVPSGAKRSALTIALLRHDGPVLLVKAQGGASTQLVNDRPLLFKDRVSVVTTVGISYLLTEPPGGHLVAAGVKVGRANLSGVIGKSLDWTVEPAAGS
jgi:hypothetical protein